MCLLRAAERGMKRAPPSSRAGSTYKENCGQEQKPKRQGEDKC